MSGNFNTRHFQLRKGYFFRLYQTTLKNLINARIISKRYSPTDAIEKADLESKKAQYLFRDHSGSHFMDMETYDTIVLGDDMAGQSKDFLKENIAVEILYYEHRPVTIELPTSVDLKVTESAPGIRGDTSGKAMKPATLGTGVKVQVPLFVEEGDTVKVDTRTCEYLGRA